MKNNIDSHTIVRINIITMIVGTIRLGLFVLILNYEY